MSVSFALTSDLIADLKDLENQYAEAFASLKSASVEELEALHKYVRVSMIGSSTRIENALLTDIEINWIDTILTANGKPTAFNVHKNLIENKLSKDRERSIEEVAGCRAVIMLIYANPREFYPLKEHDLRALHYELMSPYTKAIPYAGKYKTVTNSVIERHDKTGKSRTVFETAPPGPITSAAMHDLVEWYNETLSLSPWPISVASELVYRFLAIHPFQDGNGRLGRSLFLLSLLQSQSHIVSFVSKYIPIDRYIEKHKEEYYLVLNRCSQGKYKSDPKNYNIQYFLKFMIKILKESIESIETYRKKFQAETKLSSSAMGVLSCFREHPEIRLTTSKIMEQTKFPRRTVVYAINNLLDSQLIQKYGQGAATRYQITF